MSESIKHPYVGVSGVTSPDMQATIETIAKEAGLLSEGRRLALGVKAVHKTQMLDIENKYGGEWYPVGEAAFTSALRPDTSNPHTVAVAQAYFDVAYVDNPGYRDLFLQRIVNRGKPWLRAIQFDMLPWHKDNNEIWRFLEKVKGEGVEVFLQAHKNAMETLGPKGTAQLLGRYVHLLDYVLFDASHGTGTRLDTAALEPFIAEASATFDPRQTGVAVAGGLNGRIVRDDLPALVAAYPNLSWDAEGQLHPVSETGKRPLDVLAVQAYLGASARVLAALH